MAGSSIVRGTTKDLGWSPIFSSKDLLSHVDTSMVHKTYGRYIPNLTKMDGSAIERQFAEFQSKKGNQRGHKLGHNRDSASCQ
jgi:hypothetical protein